MKFLLGGITEGAEPGFGGHMFSGTGLAFGIDSDLDPPVVAALALPPFQRAAHLNVILGKFQCMIHQRPQGDHSQRARER